MILTLDIGNTFPNYCSWDNEKNIITSGLVSSIDTSLSYQAAVISSVADKHIPAAISANKFIYIKDFFKNNQLLNLPVHYGQTLGTDRMVQAWELFNQNKFGLLIDAGSFITMDIITNQGFMGGYILPGINKLLDIYASGEKLPALTKVELLKQDDLSLPQNTASAILQGIQRMLLSSVDRIKQQYQLTEAQIYVTGGDAELFKKWYPASLAMPELMHRSLINFYGAV